jgi:carbamoyltransferase
MSVIFGINALHAGSSAALVVDGKPVAAIAEERLNRVKYYAGFPTLAIGKCLEMAGLEIGDVDNVAVGRDSSANLGKKLQYALANPSKLLNLARIKSRRSGLDDLKSQLARDFDVDPSQLKFEQHNIEHHLAHTASAYFVSDWEEAAGFTLDGSGDFVTCMLSHCQGNQISIKHRVHVPHSLGSLYTMICEFIGYDRYGDEGKVMGLAPLGQDTYHDHFEKMVVLTENGMELNPQYFQPFGENQGMSINEKGQIDLHRHYSDYVCELFGDPRDPHAEIPQRDQDLAFGLQRVFEKGYMHLLNILHRKVPCERIAMAGGCVLNSVANGKMFDETPFRQTCIQPAAGDDGLSLGAALYVSHAILGGQQRFAMRDAYLGPEYSEQEIRHELEAKGVSYVHHERESLLNETAQEISQGNVVGWFQGRMEWGPRALGNRSILAHPGLTDMKDVLNARIKHRESFRPFAPTVIQERQAEIFEHTHPSPFMLHVYKIRPEWREKLVAVNHLDNTGRLQTLTHEENPLYYDLIKKFEGLTGIPIILNTSFNENEPIVCQPSEAIDCFQRTKMDTLVVGPFVCKKSAAEG